MGGEHTVEQVEETIGGRKYADWREGRRFRAWELKQMGWAQVDIAEALGVTPGAVSQWFKRVAEEGLDGLRRRVPSGRPPQLTDDQVAELAKLLEECPRVHGIDADEWTWERVAALIESRYGVCHHPSHVGRILNGMDTSS